jgi:hypothetical protein
VASRHHRASLTYGAGSLGCTCCCRHRVRVCRYRRYVEFSETLVKARELLLELAKLPGAQLDNVLGEHGLDPEQLAQRDKGGERPGRRPMNDDRRLAELAASYIAFSLEERAPVVKLAKQENLTHGHTKRLLAQARQRGLLTPAQGTRAGGALTDKARALLETTPPKEER